MSNFRVVLYFVISIVLVFIMCFILDSLGIFGRTYVERKVFENSYQRIESVKSEISINEATLVEIETRLKFSELDKNTRHNLEAQASALRIRIRAAKEQLK